MSVWRSAGAVTIAWLLAGCGSLRAYDHLQAGEQSARIKGDYRVSAGTPVKVLLRSVDDQPLEFWQSAADVAPGEHRLLIDCQVSDGNHLSRHELKVDVDSGITYRLYADATPQNGCTQVYMREARL